VTAALFFTRTAKLDLERIGDFIARDNPGRAVTFVDELEARCRRITDFPEAAPLRTEYRDGIRSVVYRAYVIFYSVRAGDVVVVERIVQGTRDLSELRDLL